MDLDFACIANENNRRPKSPDLLQVVNFTDFSQLVDKLQQACWLTDTP